MGEVGDYRLIVPKTSTYYGGQIDEHHACGDAFAHEKFTNAG
jgi:hypothetical protein